MQGDNLIVIGTSLPWRIVVAIGSGLFAIAFAAMIAGEYLIIVKTDKSLRDLLLFGICGALIWFFGRLLIVAIRVSRDLWCVYRLSDSQFEAESAFGRVQKTFEWRELEFFHVDSFAKVVELRFSGCSRVFHLTSGDLVANVSLLSRAIMHVRRVSGVRPSGDVSAFNT